MNKSTYTSDICIKYGDKFTILLIQNSLGCLLMILYLGKHIFEYITSKLSSACYAMRSVKPYVTEEFRNDLLFPLSLCYDLGIIVLMAFPRQCKNLQVAKENN
jgi:hypothetical protein